VTVEELASEYIRKTERVFEELRKAEGPGSPEPNGARKVVEEARRYLQDAKYYLEQRRFETSLASVAYCEGLLDALRMLGFVEFSW